MLKISFEREINADIEKSFDIITNFENFQKKCHFSTSNTNFAVILL